MRAWGHARHTTIHGAVVNSTATQLVLSTGTSTLLVNRASAVATVAKSGRHSHASGSMLGVGTEVRVGLDIQPTGLDATSITDLGMSGFIGLDGTLGTITPASGTTLGTLVINVEDGAQTTVTIPASITIPSTIAAGDTVELLTAYAAGTFTLVTITDDSIAANQVTNGVSTDQNNAGYIEAEGLVTAYSPVSTTSGSATSGSLTVQPGDGVAAMTFTIPTGPPTVVVPATLQVGSHVHVIATVSGATLNLVSVSVQQPEGEGNGSMTTQTEGIVMSVPTPTSSNLVIQPGDGQSPVTFVVPSGMDVSSIIGGARVHVTGVFVNGVLTLQGFKVQQPEGDQGNQTGSTHIDGTVLSYGVTGGIGQLVILQSDGGGTVTFNVPANLQPTVSAFAPDAHVTVWATLAGTALTLSNILPND